MQTGDKVLMVAHLYVQRLDNGQQPEQSELRFDRRYGLGLSGSRAWQHNFQA